MLFNNPRNPTTAIFSQQIEVWEHVVFGGHTHQSMLSRPGMRGRTHPTETAQHFSVHLHCEKDHA